MTQLKRTALYPIYEKWGAKTIDFGGWELPVQFSGIHSEHEAVRTRAGLFDVSHMGEFIVKGEAALSFLQNLLTNDAAKLETGQAQYSLMCYPDGGVVDDLLVYKLGPDEYMLVVNAANIDKDLEWLEKHREGPLELKNISEETALIALQGPAALRVIRKVIDAPLEQLKPFHFLNGPFQFVEEVPLESKKILISRTGYTGEDGFECYVSAGDAAVLWEALLAAGQEDGVIPVGLGARDTLRFEARLPLYGQELSASITPIEAGLGMFVKLDKGDFIGREALAEQKEAGARRKLVGLEMIDRGIPRTHYPVYADGKQIGEVTTGTQSPTFKTNVGLALVDRAYSEWGTEVWVEIRGKRLKARVVRTPFYKRERQ